MKEDIFNKAVKCNEPGDVSESGLKNAAEMFEAIQDSEASERAKQCLVLAEQARQKAIYLKAANAQLWKTTPSGLEDTDRLLVAARRLREGETEEHLTLR